jgi:hypothetical protein
LRIVILTHYQPGDEQVTAGTGVVLAGAAASRPSSDQGAGHRRHRTPGLRRRDHRHRARAAVVELAELFVNKLLPFFDQSALSHQLWSPDSASILLPLVDASAANRVAAVPADSSAPRPVAGGAKGFWSP